MPKVSVIVPVYNVDKYLMECLDSILNQTFSDIEIVCVNDASPDNSASILEEYAWKDSRIKIITHQSNCGLGAARNTGVASASSYYISFVDSDDTIEPEFIETLFNLIKDHNAELSWCGNNTIDDDGNYLETYPIPQKIWNVSEILNCAKLYPSILPVWNKMFVRELIKGIKQLPIVSEDQPALAEYFCKCKKISTSNHSLYNYRQNSNTLSKPKETKPELWDDFFYSHFLFFEILKTLFPKRNQLRKQAILRYFSLLWRIKTFDLLESNSWKEQENKIYNHIKMDRIGLKKFSPLVYWSYFLLFHLKWSQKNKRKLLNLLFKLTRKTWVNNSYWVLLPFDLLKLSTPYLKNKIKISLYHIEVLFVKFLVAFYQITIKREIWLLGERPDTAQDNGIYMFRYLQNEHPELISYYVIDKNSNQYKELSDKKNIVSYNSIKHKILFTICKYYITSHNRFCLPVSKLGNQKYRKSKKTKNIFLQHGITCSDNSDEYGKKNSSIDLFLCGAELEYEFVKRNFGYLEEEVKYTGFARFDGLHDFATNKKILLMPTWRKQIWQNRLKNNHEFFLKSEYFKRFQSLISNVDLLEILEKYEYQLIFYPHYEIQPYLKYFISDSERVILAPKEAYNLQELLKTSALLITDTSSVNFDFAYMFKPSIYYLFDRESYNKYHFKPGYFKHEELGFGEVIYDETKLINTIYSYLKSGCKMQDLYKTRAMEFFPQHDKRNSERIFKEIQNSKNY